MTAPLPEAEAPHATLRMQQWGEHGSRVLLVHGGVANGEATWSEQRPLEERWSLQVLDRRGYFPNPSIDREDFEVDAVDVAALIAELGPVHVVGHSYGGVVTLLAAPRQTDSVLSLTLIEPPAFGAAPDDPDVKAFVDGLRELWYEGPRDPEAFLRAFLDHTGVSFRRPGPLPAPLLQNTRLLQKMRLPDEAVIPFAALRRAPFPKLVVSGGHSAAFERTSDVVAAEIGGARLVLPGAGHAAQRTGAPFNQAIEQFWTAAEAASPLQ